VCKTGAVGSLREGPVIATIGEAGILWETPFKYQVSFVFHCFVGIRVNKLILTVVIATVLFIYLFVCLFV